MLRWCSGRRPGAGRCLTGTAFGAVGPGQRSPLPRRHRSRCHRRRRSCRCRRGRRFPSPSPFLVLLLRRVATPQLPLQLLRLTTLRHRRRRRRRRWRRHPRRRVPWRPSRRLSSSSCGPWRRRPSETRPCCGTRSFCSATRQASSGTLHRRRPRSPSWRRCPAPLPSCPPQRFPRRRLINPPRCRGKTVAVRTNCPTCARSETGSFPSFRPRGVEPTDAELLLVLGATRPPLTAAVTDKSTGAEAVAAAAVEGALPWARCQIVIIVGRSGSGGLWPCGAWTRTGH